MKTKLFFICFNLYIVLINSSYINMYSNYNANKHNNICIKNICNPIDIADNILNAQQKEYVIRTITDFLPAADAIGSFILNSNEYLINNIFDTNILNEQSKKNLILKLISIAINGDNYGGQFLHFYYDLVDTFL